MYEQCIKPMQMTMDNSSSNSFIYLLILIAIEMDTRYRCPLYAIWLTWWLIDYQFYGYGWVECVEWRREWIVIPIIVTLKVSRTRVWIKWLGALLGAICDQYRTLWNQLEHLLSCDLKSTRSNVYNYLIQWMSRCTKSS